MYDGMRGCRTVIAAWSEQNGYDGGKADARKNATDGVRTRALLLSRGLKAIWERDVITTTLRTQHNIAWSHLTAEHNLLPGPSLMRDDASSVENLGREVDQFRP